MSVTLPAKKFGLDLFHTDDLDPVYVALAGTTWSHPLLLARVCVAYWCLYSLGAACRIAEGKGGFWTTLMKAAINADRKWPRGAERRHWRGRAAVDSVAYLTEHFNNAYDLIEYVAAGRTFQGVSKLVQEFSGFGPWIGFKVADTLERVWRYPISFADCHLSFFEEPRRGAALFLYGDADRAITPEGVQHAAGALRKQLGTELLAPPWQDRPINIQELETIFCKWKSHCGGHYWVGKDIHEVRHGLVGWGDLAQEVLLHMPKEVDHV